MGKCEGPFHISVGGRASRLLAVPCSLAAPRSLAFLSLSPLRPSPLLPPSIPSSCLSLPDTHTYTYTHTHTHTQVPLIKIVAGIEAVDVIPGRCEIVDEGQDFSVIVDAADTPEALDAMLSALRGNAKNIYTVFGCRGEEDR
jgi:hypothetical protein